MSIHEGRQLFGDLHLGQGLGDGDVGVTAVVPATRALRRTLTWDQGTEMAR
ncbi:MAG: hypothetical protein WAK86_00330 [Pseudonocardiaceae bacterium]